MLRKFIEMYVRRGFSSSVFLRNVEKNVEKTESEKYSSSSGSFHSFRMDFSPTPNDKKVLVWSGRFKSEKDIPPRVTVEMMSNARSRLRIRGANLLMVLTICLCCFYVWLGKKKSQGDSLVKQAREYRDKVLREEAEKK